MEHNTCREGKTFALNLIFLIAFSSTSTDVRHDKHICGHIYSIRAGNQIIFHIISLGNFNYRANLINHI